MNMHVEPDISGAASPCLLSTLVSLEILSPAASVSAPPATAEGIFAVGDYARARHGIVYILDGGNTDGYSVSYIGYDKETFYRPADLTPWVPMVGEHVCDVDDEDESIGGKIQGVVVGIGNGTSLIKWPRHAEPQTWANADLEPAWD